MSDEFNYFKISMIFSIIYILCFGVLVFLEINGGC